MMDQNTSSVASLGRIGVVMGGCSSEREISLKSGNGVFAALTNSGCDAVAIDLQTTDEKEILKQLRDARVDIVFLILHGKFGEDGTIQAILDKAGIFYTGSGAQASRLAMDKAATQALLQKNGILVPPFFVLSKAEQGRADEFLKNIGGCPVVVKPSGEGSSIGITIVHRPEEFSTAINKAFEYGQQVLVERYIAGRELTSGILNAEALALIEIKPSHEFFDFTAKYQKGLSDYCVPAQIDEEKAADIREISKKVFNLIGCRDMARSDFILDDKGNAYFLEINTIPGFTQMSLLPKAAKEQGISFEELCLKLAGFATARRAMNARVSLSESK
jgi:D-alanine-D-alanine ligase